MKRSIVTTLMVACTALFYGGLLFVSQFAGVVHLSKKICDMSPSAVRDWREGWPLFWSVTYGLEIPVLFACGIIAAFFMVLVFRSTSWRFGLLAALVGVAMLHYALMIYLPVFIAIEVLSLPVACTVLSRVRKLSNYTAQPIAGREAASGG